MNKCFKVGLVALAAAALFGAQAVAAAPLDLTDGDKIKLTRTGTSASYGGAFGGGEFTVNGVTVLNGAGDSFMTFCIEFSEHISLNTNYFVKINTGAVNGGFGSSGTYAGDPNGTSTFDPISTATAWLYTEFRNGSLSGFANNGASNNSLQLAIWHLEDELHTSGASASALAAYNADTVAQGWVALATGANWANLGNVRVLNLYDTYNSTTGYFSGKHQDQLYLLPIPEPEIYAMLAAGLGLMGFVARRRKRQIA